MDKIKELTKEQEEYLPIFREECRKIALKSDPIDKDNARKAVKDLYKAAGQDEPVVLFFDSPLQCLFARLILKNLPSFDDQLLHHLSSKLFGQIDDQLDDQLFSQLSDQLCRKLGGQLIYQLWGQLKRQLKGQFNDQLKDQLRNQLFGEVSDQIDYQLKRQLLNQLDDQLLHHLSGKLLDQIDDQLDDQLSSQLSEQLWRKLGGQLIYQLWDQLRDKLNGPLNGLIKDQPRNQLYGEVSDQIDYQLLSQLLINLSGQLKSQLDEQLDDQLYDKLSDKFKGQLKDQLKDLNQSLWMIGGWDYYWLSFYKFAQIIGVKYKNQSHLDAYINYANECSGMYAYKNIAFCFDRPKTKFDENNLLHCEDDYAMKFNDGYGFCAWHGTRVPDDWILKKSLDAKTVITWENTEQRRAAYEIYGWVNILSELNSVTIDKNSDDYHGELLEVDIPDIGKEKILKYKCGTGRWFASPVSPHNKTAIQAQAELRGLPEAIIAASNTQLRT